MASMKIIHMSDLHIADKGKPIWDTDTLAHFDAALERIETEENIDAIFITGDIAVNGSEWAYEYVDEARARLGIPTYVCPGNHDWIPNMKNTLKFCQMPRAVKIGSWDFILLDSTMLDPDIPSKNRARGYITDDDLSSLNLIADKSDCPICILLHHSPIEPGGWMNRKLLENRNLFKERLSEMDNVKLVLFGHIHYPLSVTHKGVLYNSAPSIGFAFDKDLPKYHIAAGCEGYNLICINESEISINVIRIV